MNSLIAGSATLGVVCAALLGVVAVGMVRQ